MRTQDILNACIGIALALPTSAMAQEACKAYRVVEGDTLRSIAERAYGTSNYQPVFNANREFLIASNGSIREGDVLDLPCSDGRRSEAEVLAPAAADQPIEPNHDDANIGTPYTPPIKFVTIDDWAPFADKRLPGGGIMTRIAQTALVRGGNNRKSTFHYVNDSDAQLHTIVGEALMDFTSAWIVPDCTKLDVLSPSSAELCTRFLATDPAYEVVITLASKSENPFAGAETYADLKGARICRPEGWETHMIEEQGLNQTNVTLLRPKTSMDCAEAIADGSADIFLAEVELADRHFRDLNLADEITYNDRLAFISAFRYVISRTNRNAQSYVDMMNAGLSEMRTTGEWYDITASTLAEYNASLLGDQ